MSIAQLLARLVGRQEPAPVDHDEMLRLVDAGNCRIVDVREPHEFSAGHIPGATNHPLSNFDPRRLDEGRPVILVCQAGGRSAKALQKALEAGCRNIRHYPPGTGGWKARGGDMSKD
jgi:rhodanese-related sulfurtransferase